MKLVVGRTVLIQGHTSQHSIGIIVHVYLVAYLDR